MPQDGDTDLDQHGVSAEKLQLLHRLHVQCYHGVVIVHGLINNQTIGSLLALQNGSGEILLCWLAAQQNENENVRSAGQTLDTPEP